MDVRREAGDDDPPLDSREDLLEVRPHARLRGGDAGPVHVRGVAEQEQDALAAELGEPRDVGRLSVDRGLVELVVAREDRGAELAGEGDGAGVGYRVRHLDRLDAERTGVEALAREDLLDRSVLEP